MDCLSVQQDLDALREGRSSDGQADRLRAHLAGCDACRAFAADVALLRERLMAEPVPAVPASLRRRLREPAAPASVSLWSRRRVLPCAAALALALGLAFVLSRWRAPSDAPFVEHTVTLAVESAGDLPGVTLRLILPPGAEVAGHPGRAEIEWQDDLVAGVNRLRIPLRLREGTDGVLVARIERQNKVRELNVLLPDRRG